MSPRSTTSAGMTRLSKLLLKDLAQSPGLTPLFGIEQREAVIAERWAEERRLAGKSLQNIEALVECITATYDEHDRREITAEQALYRVWVAVQAIDQQNSYDELELVQAASE